MKQLYNYEDRLVRFAGEVVFFVGTAPENYAGKYYSNQLTRSSGSGVLNYGEAQGTVTKKDFIYLLDLGNFRWRLSLHGGCNSLIFH